MINLQLQTSKSMVTWTIFLWQHWQKSLTNKLNFFSQVLSGVDEVLSNLDQPNLCFSLIRFLPPHTSSHGLCYEYGLNMYYTLYNALFRLCYKKNISCGLFPERLEPTTENCKASNQNTSRYSCSIFPSSIVVLKHRNNCECCPGHYLTVSLDSIATSLFVWNWLSWQIV